MRKYFKILAIAAPISLVIFLALVVINKKPAGAPQSANIDTQKVESVKNEPGTEAQLVAEGQNGMYSDYTDDIFAKTNGKRILFFHADWCPQCRQLDQSIKSGTIPSGVTIFKVDYDSHQALRQKYGVTIQTTLVLLDNNGELIKKYVAYDQPSLSSLITNLL